MSVLAASCCSVLAGLMLYGMEEGAGLHALRLFTIDSNLLAGVSACILMYRLLSGSSCPRWTLLLHYGASVSAALTMLFAVLCMSWYDPGSAFGGYNLILHIFSPVLILLSFFLLRPERPFSFPESFLAMIPFVVYALVYVIETGVMGTGRGEWTEQYLFPDAIPTWLILSAFLIVDFGIASVLRKIPFPKNAISPDRDE